MIEKEVNDFIKNIQLLEIAKNGLENLLYIAKHNNSADLAQFEKTHALANQAQRNLMIAIDNELKISPNPQNHANAESQLAQIIDIINKIQNQRIPNKPELLNMLESCAKSFATNNIAKVLTTIKQDPTSFAKQILFLEEIWINYEQ